ncbi:hypothetical protein U876_23975 [Aeromonas hydrophila NJ-35]|uniref:hypothetical protein n=1 Tax=Aeromonas TaxID=642 RepID=UPI000640A3B0|nr:MULTISPECIES: hypothetical protein [Aeromonas]AKJ37121.1 hypothetical protein U876_23975 [Aeromonas hydrophila NJ-35]ALZ82607.1 hypothetical protein AhyD4_23670 [Aeromonas hydrophila]
MKKLLAVTLALTSISGFSYTSPEDAFEDADFVDVVFVPYVSDEAIYLTKGYESLRGVDEFIEVIMMVNNKLADECGAVAEPSSFATSRLIATMADAQRHGNHDVVKAGLDKVTCAIFNQDNLNQELDAKKGVQTPRQGKIAQQ